MKEHPALMCSEMVRALLRKENPKTMTRRVAKFVPLEAGLNLGFSGLTAGHYCTGAPEKGWVLYSRDGGGVWQQRTKVLRSPYGTPVEGSRIWVRETWAVLTGNGHRIVYRADADPPLRTDGTPIEDMKWRPSIFLRRADSRILLELTSLRVERLQSITEEDAKAEGMTPLAPGEPHRAAFARGWDELHGDRGGRVWKANPWVFVLGFRRIE